MPEEVQPPDFRGYPLGRIPDFRDDRDYLKAKAPVELPQKAFTGVMPAIRDQGTKNSCTGHTAAWFWEQVLASRQMVRLALSPMYLWYYARSAWGGQDKNGGASMRNVMDALHKHGAPPEDVWPYSSHYAQEPNNLAKAYGQAVRLPQYERCQSIDDVKYAIAHEGISVCLGVFVYENWYDEQTEKTGRIFWLAGTRRLGGHTVAVCGYDDDMQAVRIANSWGVNWGDGGFGWLAYEYFYKDWFDAWTANAQSLPSRDPLP